MRAPTNAYHLLDIEVALFGAVNSSRCHIGTLRHWETISNLGTITNTAGLEPFQGEVFLLVVCRIC